MALSTQNIDAEIVGVEAKIAVVQGKIDQVGGALQTNKTKLKKLSNMLARLQAMKIQADRYNTADSQG